MNTLTSFFSDIRRSPLLMGMILAISAFFISLLLTGDTFAAFGFDDQIKIDDAKDGDLKSSVISILNYLLTFIGLLLVVIIIYAGFRIIVSQGEEEELTKGRTMIVYAIIGIVIIVLSYTIVDFIAGAVDGGSDSGSGVTG